MGGFIKLTEKSVMKIHLQLVIEASRNFTGSKVLFENRRTIDDEGKKLKR